MLDNPNEAETSGDDGVSRRRFLSRAGLALGAAPLAALAAAEPGSAFAPAVPPPTVYDVSTYGAQGDGAADDTNAIQAAIDAANARGGGTVVFPAGTFRVTRGLTIYSRTVFRGAGMRATVIRKASGGGNYPIVRSAGYDPGQTLPDPIYSFSFQNISFDGNRAGGALGHGVQVLAYGYSLVNVSIFGCGGRGLWSEYLGILPPDNQSLEAMLTSVSVHNCTQGGIYWNGPHDSQWVNVVAYLNGPLGAQTGSTTRGVETAPHAAGLRASNCHIWGPNHRYAWYLNSEAPGLVNCTGEGAEYAQVVLIGNDSQVVGGKYFGARSDRRTVAIQIGDASLPAPAGTFVNTKVVDCDLGALYFVNDNGIGRYALSVWQTTGRVVVVAPGVIPRQSNRFDLQASGGATWGDLAGLKPVTFQEDVLTTRGLEVRGHLRVGSSTSKLGLFGAVPVGRSEGWGVSGVVGERRALEGSADLAAMREVLGTLVRDLKRYGLLGE